MLQGRLVRLEPLEPGHAAGLSAIGLAPSLWTWMLETIATPADMEGFVARAIADPKAEAFAVRHLATGRLAGSTRYMNMEPAHFRLEIGSTWYGEEFQRTGVNTECKYLLMRHAFEERGMNRVELKTDALNARSRAAILRIGAKEEGTLRRHMVAAGGRVRDTVYFSVLREEWPEVKARLEEMQEKFRD